MMVILRLQEAVENSNARYEATDDYHSKRRKDEEYLRKDHADGEEIMHGHRESSSSRRKRERNEILDQRKRDEQQRIRDSFDEHHSVRHKDEVWLHRERVGDQGIQSLNFQGFGVAPWIQLRLDTSSIPGVQPDLYQTMAAAALQKIRKVDSSKIGSQSLLQILATT